MKRHADIDHVANLQRVTPNDDFVKRPSSRRAKRGVLPVRRSDRALKRNAEIGRFTKSSRKEQSAWQATNQHSSAPAKTKTGASATE
jgi:hypothetical protein